VLIDQYPYSIIYRLIPHGRSNAVPAAQIVGLTKLDERSIRIYVEAMRREGHIIASSSKGYYFPASIEELKEYVQRTEKTAKSALYTLRHARKALKVQEAEYAKII